jgi:two-component system OmpR family sensor kinase
VTDPRDPAVTGAITTPDADAPVAGVQGGRGSAVRRLERRIEGMSLRARLLAILVISLLAALTLTGYGVQLAMSRYLVQQIDDELVANYSRALRDEGFVNALNGDRRPPTSFATFISVDGHPELTSTRSGRPDTSPPVFESMTSAAASATEGRVFTLHSSNGAAWRAVAMPGTLTAGGSDYPAAIVLALPLQGVHDAVNQLRLGTLVLGLIVIGLGGGVGWLAIRRSFRPLVEVEETAAAIAAGDLSRRIPPRPATTEVGRLTTSLNGMLTRIESAFRAQEASEARTRRFAADASHELRTPLVSIRGFAELYRQGAVPGDEVPRTMRRIEDEAKRMGSLVEDLLLLARLDEQRPGRKDPVDLAVLAGDAVHDARGLDADRLVSFVGLDGVGPTPAVVIGDEDRLRQVVANLVANAIRHTPAGTPVEVAVGRTTATDGTDGNGGNGGNGGGGVRAVLEVRDHGPGLTPEQSEKVFERFYRLDSSRRRDTGGGSGLGLSIVSAVVAAHAGTVTVVPTPGGGATFRVSLPARTEPSGPAGPDPGDGQDVVDGRARNGFGRGRSARATSVVESGSGSSGQTPSTRR